MNSATTTFLATWLTLLAPCASATPAGPTGDLAHRVDFEQHLNGDVPAALGFHDETNDAVRLGDYFGGGPLVLLFTYYGCSNLCPTVIGNLAGRLDAAALPPAARPQVIVVSVDPDDSPSLAARKKAELVSRKGVNAQRWHLLTSEQATIAQLAQIAGFRYVYDSASHQYAHPAGIVLLTPQGRIARYLLGFDYTSAELASALSEAAAQHVASPMQRLLLICFHYDPVRGPRSATVLAALQGLSAALLLLLAAFALLRRARRRGAGARST